MSRSFNINCRRQNGLVGQHLLVDAGCVAIFSWTNAITDLTFPQLITAFAAVRPEFVPQRPGGHAHLLDRMFSAARQKSVPCEAKNLTLMRILARAFDDILFVAVVARFQVPFATCNAFQNRSWWKRSSWKSWNIPNSSRKKNKQNKQKHEYKATKGKVNY